MKCSDELDKLEEALESFQMISGFVKATLENPYHKNKYANYNLVVSKTRSDLKKSGLRVKQAVTNLDGKAAIYTRLSHIESKQFMETIAPIEYKAGDPQSQGSAITYMKRYAYVAILDLLVDADDDGNLASGLGKESDKKKDAAEFFAEKAKMIRALRQEGLTIEQIGSLVDKTLSKPRIETLEDIEKVLSTRKK